MKKYIVSLIDNFKIKELRKIAKKDKENKYGNMIYKLLANRTEKEYDHIFTIMEFYYDFRKSTLRNVIKGEKYNSEQVYGTRRRK